MHWQASSLVYSIFPHLLHSPCARARARLVSRLQSLHGTAPERPLDLACYTLIIDDIVLYTGETVMASLGGGGAAQETSQPACFDYAASHVCRTSAGGAVRPPLMRASTGAAPVGRSASSRAAPPVQLCGARDRPASVLCLPALTVPPRQGRSRCGARGCACRSCARTWPPASATTCRRRARRSCGTCSARRAAACSCTRGSARCAPGNCSRRTACARRRGPPAARGRCGAAGLLRVCGQAGRRQAAGGLLVYTPAQNTGWFT
jgi:hypothetical protein